MGTDGTDGFREAAWRIGRRLAASAQWEGDACHWIVRRPARGDNRFEVELVPGGPALYQGAAGVALFLARLLRHGDDAEVRRALVGALRHLEAELAEPAPMFGFHGGRVGAAYAAVHAAAALGDDRWIGLAASLLRPLAGQEAQDRGLDVIGGGAGAIPALLEMASVLPHELTTGMAVALGEHLMRTARREPGGWGWGEQPSSVRCLLGYAHGASGFAHAFLELWNATGDGRFLFAAEQAIAYEGQFLDEAKGNWPDFRWAELSLYYSDNRLEELAALLRDGGQVTPYETRFMSAWCHGAPGIGLVRLRAYALTGRERYRDEARIALANTRATLTMLGNWSQCHGISGNAETLLLAADVLGLPEARAEAAAAMRRGIDENEQPDRHWASGTMGGGPDPSFMMGDAGIGHALLRLADPDTPSVLLVQPAPAAGRLPGTDAGYASAAAAEAALWFPQAIAAARLAGLTPPPPAEAAERGEAYARHLHRWLESVAGGTGETAALVEDALAADRLRFALAESITDLSEPALERLRGYDRTPVDWTETEAVLSPKVRIAEQRHDWDAWLAAGAAGAAGRPEEKPTFTLVYRVGNDVRALRITPLAALVLRSTAEPGTLETVVQRVEEALDAAGHREVLRAKVAEQLRNAHAVGAVEPVREVAAA